MKLPTLSPLAFYLVGLGLVAALALSLVFLGEKSTAVVGMITTLFGLLVQQKPQTSPALPEELTKEKGELE